MRPYADEVVTKRPHYVPRTYLGAWANAGGQVAYRRRDRVGAIVTNTKNVAVAIGIYGEGELGQLREEFFQQIEGEWVGLRRELVQRGDLTAQRRSVFAIFAAIQLMRTLKHSNEMNFIRNVASMTDQRPVPRDAVRKYLAALDGAEPHTNEVEAAWTYINGTPGGKIPNLDEMHGVAMDVAVRSIAPRLEQMMWTVNEFDNPELMSNDCPVHAWRRPVEDALPGGIGIETADEVRFPLSPTALLVMTRNGREASEESQEPKAVNGEIARQCHQFVIGTPNSKPALDQFVLAERAPRLRFRTGPLLRAGPDGTDENMGEILHLYVQ